MTKSKKMLALVIALVVMLVAVSGTLIAVLVAGNQNAQSKVHVKYTSSDVNVKVEAKYYVGSTGTDMVDKSNSNAKSIELDANKATGSLDQPTNEVSLTKENNKIIYEYKFTNLSTTIPATIGQLVEDGSVVVPKDSNNNVKLTYTSSSTSLGSGATSDATTLNTQGLPASSTRYVYVIVSIVELLNDVDFEGTFGWDLAKGTTASLDTTGSGNSIVNVNTSQTGFYNAAALQNIELMVGVENQEPDIYPMIANKCFTGWYTDSALTNKAVFPMVVTADTKLYAKNETATSDLPFTYSNNAYGITDGSMGSPSYTGSATSIIIPDVYNDGTNGVHPVTSIGACAFFQKSINSVIIPDTVTMIGSSTFFECTGLTSVTIPDGVSYIPEWVFFKCSGLKKVTIGSGSTRIDTNAFQGCSGLTNITVSRGNTIYCSEGNCLIVRSSNTLILGCNNSIIPSSVTSIGSSAFSGCSGFTSITIPDSVTSIGNNAFENCSKLASITIGSGVKKIGSSAFSGCSKLTSATFKTTTGWTVTTSYSATTGTAVTISTTDLAANATLLKTTHVSKYWNRA